MKPHIPSKAILLSLYALALIAPPESSQAMTKSKFKEGEDTSPKLAVRITAPDGKVPTPLEMQDLEGSSLNVSDPTHEETQPSPDTTSQTPKPDDDSATPNTSSKRKHKHKSKITSQEKAAHVCFEVDPTLNPDEMALATLNACYANGCFKETPLKRLITPGEGKYLNEEAAFNIYEPENPPGLIRQVMPLFDTKDNPLGTRLEDAIREQGNQKFLGRLSALVSPENVKAINDKPGFFGLTGTPLRNKLKDIKNQERLFVIASGAEIFFKGLKEDYREDEKQSRLRALDRIDANILYAFLNCIDDETKKREWYKSGKRKQDLLLASLEHFQPEQIPMIYQDLSLFSVFEYDFFQEYTTLISDFDSFMMELKVINDQQLHILIENWDLIFNKQNICKSSDLNGDNQHHFDSASKLVQAIKQFETTEDFERVINDIRKREGDLFRYGTTLTERLEIIISLMPPDLMKKERKKSSSKKSSRKFVPVVHYVRPITGIEHV